MVFLTSDTLGIPRAISDDVTPALKEKFGLARDQIVLSASHTHCGPVLRGALMDMYPLDDAQLAAIDKYTVGFEEKIIDTVGMAIADLAPVRVRAGQGTTGFAVNRRNNPEAKVPRLLIDGALKGPVDHAVPVLCVARPDGTPKAILFGYACHNTVMSFYKWSGDYAGLAQLAIEKSHSNTTAMFFMGCGGDQNPPAPPYFGPGGTLRKHAGCGS